MNDTVVLPKVITEEQAVQLGMSVETYTNFMTVIADLTTPSGGQDRKYQIRDGRFVNRVSGEPIPLDEPTVIFRARDHHSLTILKRYRELLHEDIQIKATDDRIREFEMFATAHPDRMKEPGTSGHIVLNEEVEKLFTPIGLDD